MQKLVYDNYNKFISATETIKEMKSDVFAMDDDMLAVRFVLLSFLFSRVVYHLIFNFSDKKWMISPIALYSLTVY
jgi:hypothetical protein